MNLFICKTPLQCLIASNIIRQQDINKMNAELFYYSYTDNSINRKYFNELSTLVSTSNYIKQTKKSFLYFSKLKNLFKNKEYDTVYFASVDSQFIYFILSIIKFKKIITFDDGTANLVDTSIYYSQQRNFKTKIRDGLYKTLGVKFNLFTIKNNINQHYTIYPNIKNISDQIKNINIFDLNLANNEILKKNECIVILGTVYDEIVSEKNKNELIHSLQNFINNTNDDNIFYFPHPRDFKNHFENVIYDNSNLLSEEKILNLLKQFNTIKIYGFNSSTQFNLVSIKNIQNHYFSSLLLKKNLVSYENLSKKFNFQEVKLNIKEDK